MPFLNSNKKIFWSVACLYIIWYFYVVLQNAVNFPYYDDYAAILDSVLKIKNAKSFAQFFEAIFSQHSEHRLVFTRLIAWLSTFFTSQINFRLLVLLGNLAILLIFYLLIQKTSNHHKNYLHILPIVFLVFHLQSYSNTFWAMSGLQNYWVLVWVISCIIYAFDEKQKNQNLSYFFLVLAVFTSGNGIFLVPVMAFLLALQKKFKQAIRLITIGFLLAIFYFLGFQGKEYFASNQSIFETLIRILKFLGAFVGAFVFHPNLSFISVFVGWLVILFFVYLFIQKYYLKNPKLFAFYGFLLLTGLVVSITRSKLGFEFAATSRYRINSVLLISCFYLSWIETIRTSKYILWATTLFLFVFNSYINYFYFSKVTQAKQQRLADAWLWNHGQTPSGHPDSLLVKTVLAETQKSNLFKTPFIDEGKLIYEQKFDKNSLKNLTNCEFGIDFIDSKENNVVIKGWAKFEKRKANFLNTYLLFDDGKRQFCIPALYQIRFDIAAQKKSFQYLESGFLGFIPKKGFNHFKGIFITDGQKKGFISIKNNLKN